ncbi:Protein atonal-like protein 8 [Frankliniella fusca]|uniref:Protein atonal-like protein 8 n=1 Tax=Frankliniella fusca TaxID=407009 RepID=A0AAE1LGH1_9NEOP|nr:Protein atonal-like protein 8 [Frankliniella fusca]
MLGCTECKRRGPPAATAAALRGDSEQRLVVSSRSLFTAVPLECDEDREMKPLCGITQGRAGREDSGCGNRVPHILSLARSHAPTLVFQMSLCSAEEDVSLDVEDHDDLHSPTDVSEDSVEVRVTPIAAKRKQPHLHQLQQPGAGATTALPPSPKRRRPGSPLSRWPFRPWSAPSPSPSPSPAREPAPAPQEEPLALVKTRVSTATPTVPVIPRSPRGGRPAAPVVPAAVPVPAPAPCRTAVPAARPAAAAGATRFSVESIIGDVVSTAAPPAPAPAPGRAEVLSTATRSAFSPTIPSSSRGRAREAASTVSKDGDYVDLGGGGGSGSGSRSGGGGAGGAQQRNYKNMTRERRIEANARERTRVHTISAAFDTLRRTVPAYSHSQKLSKLSVLRIACSYILTLSRVAGMDYSADQSEPPVQECVDLVSKTIQTEGKLRRKRDD